MTWEQMLQAIAALGGEPALRMRKPGDWYVEQRGVEVKQGSILASLYGNGATPEAAVRDHWQQLTDLKPDEVIVLSAAGPNRRHVRWNGFMWTDVDFTAVRA